MFAIQCKDHERPPGVSVARELESVLMRTTEDAVGILVTPLNEHKDPIRNWIKTSKYKIILTDEENICKDICDFKKPQVPAKVKKNDNFIFHLRIIIFLLIIIILFK